MCLVVNSFYYVWCECETLFVPVSVVDGEDLSNCDAADELQQQKDRDSDTLNELQRELTSHNLGSYSHPALHRCLRIDVDF